MPWTASHIFALPDPAVLAAFQAEPAIRGHVFHVTSLAGHSWPAIECHHDLPIGGLVVVREISWCNYWEDDDEDGEAEAMADEIPRAWHLASDSTSLILPPRIFKDFEPPPIRFLTFLQELSRKSRTPIAFFFCDMHGGTVELSLSWVFAKPDRFYAEGFELEEGDRMGEYVDSSTPPIGLSRGVLGRTLEHLGLFLPTLYFALHTTEFSWDAFRL